MQHIALFYVLLVAAILIPLWWLTRRFVVRKHVECPQSKKPVWVEFICGGSLTRAEPKRVKSCTGLPDPRKVTCSQECMPEVTSAVEHARPHRVEPAPAAPAD